MFEVVVQRGILGRKDRLASARAAAAGVVGTVVVSKMKHERERLCLPGIGGFLGKLWAIFVSGLLKENVVSKVKISGPAVDQMREE